MKLLRLLGVSFVVTLVSLVGGWLVEVFLSALHSAAPSIQALPYWPSVLIFVGAELVAVMLGDLA